MTDRCARCLTSPAHPALWPVCEPCWQEQCHEAHEALAECDAVARLMWIENISFIEAVEQVAKERGA